MAVRSFQEDGNVVYRVRLHHTGAEIEWPDHMEGPYSSLATAKRQRTKNIKDNERWYHREIEVTIEYARLDWKPVNL